MTLQNRDPYQNRPEGPFSLDSQISKTSVNGANNDTSTRYTPKIAIEHELEIITGKVAVDHVHIFVAYHLTQNISKIMQWLKGISSRILLSEFPHLRKQFWGRHFWAREYLAVSSGNITDEMIQEYIESQRENQSQMIVDFKSIPLEPLVL